ncbi:organic hydroperoxide resistance transcriptional regulator [Anaerocolumna cellulosilytica]|uniref:Organic hydroperoxide resistance transcriptional regulator n=1 Tax=Anaerocolumna cellulosilytica TaxID=433286 RepID=A0A6S6QZQ3_9FIRM|nr:MarR family transcriptional regulator [Anaerocolumna cellulosilytica]MBB5194258.1 DNA-binding MarR family transcriptional regulator [Anaerocolumna cellulosilytica]BCJ94529.1 organic hydroperoxide resistance transcriptional regulator [Anaerocolumna cellulosilytica]
MSKNLDKDIKNQLSDNFPHEEALKLDNQLCFALYVCSKEIIKKYKPLLDPLDLTYTGYIALLALWEKDEITVKELGNRLFLDSGTLTPLLKKLESQGFVTRIRSMDDERSVVIKLTDTGRNLKEQAFHIPQDLICSIDFSLDNTMGFMSTLHTLMEQITGKNDY